MSLHFTFPFHSVVALLFVGNYGPERLDMSVYVFAFGSLQRAEKVSTVAESYGQVAVASTPQLLLQI